MSDTITQPPLDNAIAIVGMYLRVPGADGLIPFWDNLKHGRESITFFSDDELIHAGVPSELLSHPDYVKASGRLNDIELFDASFFDMTPREAEILDPQHRILLEGVWRSLEHAGIDPQKYPGRIGLFAGVGFNRYLLNNIITNKQVIEQSGAWQLSISNDKDFAPTRVAYKLNLQGPAIAVNTACSTSLVATAMAASSLLNYQCDTAIAGGCSLNLPQDEGYIHTPGGTLSSDGHCRPFDKKGSGTIDGNGTACVVMKRYEDAIADHDTIYAVIRGFGINNDGNVKVGYTAPGVDGQTDVILEALEMAQVSPNEIDFIETHGTATELGDTVEIAALKQVFSTGDPNRNPCYLGAVKSNIGHLDTAAGATGLIKTVLSINHKTIPPTCNFSEANPLLELSTSPFKVNNHAIKWETSPDKPRIAGVSSFGIGGTNAHVIVQETPEVIHPVDESKHSDDILVLPISAKSIGALTTYLTDLADFIKNSSDTTLRNIAYTLQHGRASFQFRTVLIAKESDRASIAGQLEKLSAGLSQLKDINDQQRFLKTWVRGLKKEFRDRENSNTQRIIDTWIAGSEVDWSETGLSGRKIAIPGHPFIKARYWLDPPTFVTENITSKEKSNSDIVKIKDFKEWIYLPGWSTQLPVLKSNPLKGQWLVLDDGSTQSQQLIETLISHNVDVIRVDYDLFDESGGFNIGATKPVDDLIKSKEAPFDDDWSSFFAQNKDVIPSKILVTGFQPATADSDSSSEYLKLFDRTIKLCYGLQKSFFSEEIEIVVVGSRLLDFNKTDIPSNITEAGRTVIHGPLKVLPQECPNFSTKCIDTDNSSIASSILACITSTASGTMAILKDGILHKQVFEKVEVHDSVPSQCRIKKHGTYLITGGLGDIGLTLASYLCSNFDAKVYLTSRSQFPDRTKWDSETNFDPTTRRRIDQVKKLMDLGYKIQWIKADVSSSDEMASAVNTITTESGRIDGIIHAAGIVGDASFNTIAESVSSDGIKKNHAQFFPKTGGLDVLAKILSDKDFDFCMICSSLSPILGGLGFAAYASTNAYVDSAVTVLNRLQPGKWISINWEGWMFDHDTVPGGNAGASAAELGINANEGSQVFDLLVHQSPVTRVVISSGDLPKRIQKWIAKEQTQEIDGSPSNRHPRPDYIGHFTPPKTETEKKLAELWEQLLGIQGIGVHDSFFELGGNSLLLTQLVSLIRKHFHSELTLSKLFEQPTIFEMASDIDQASLSNTSDEFEEGVI